MNEKKNNSDIIPLKKMVLKNYKNPYKILSDIKEFNNLSITHIADKTNVNRDVISRFLDGKKINHIDYIKILNEFPQLQKTVSVTKLNISKIYMYGVVTKGGKVRHLFLREAKEWLMIDHLSKVFTKELIGMHDEHSSAKYILQLRSSSDIFKQEFQHQEFLVKTTTNAYFGIMKPYRHEYYLCDQHTLEPIDFGEDSNKPEKIIECYDLLVRCNDRWSELKDKKYSTVIADPEEIAKDLKSKL